MIRVEVHVEHDDHRYDAILETERNSVPITNVMGMACACVQTMIDSGAREEALDVAKRNTPREEEVK